MSHISQGEDQYDFDNKDKLKQNYPTLSKKSNYFIFIGLLALFVILLSCYSSSRYAQTSTMSPTIQKHLPIHAGEMHYSRVPHQYWEHRILMIKAMGLNALSVYVMWNYHQISKGKFDFQSQDKNLTAFLALAKKHSMKVLLRPGPYVCAQWDFGGLPARLLGIQGLEIRSPNILYESQVKIYFSALSEVIRPFLFANDGPIIMMQIENELGYYSNSSQHTHNLLKMWGQLQIYSEFYYTDSFQNWNKQYWPDAHIGINGGNSHNSYHQIQISHKRTNKSLVFGGEIYSGWMTHWGQQRWGDRKPNQYYKQLRGLVIYNRSLSVYVAFGGTNFGLTAGANGYEPQVQNYFDYMPHITSYDYDAPINQQGATTEKYHLVRSVFEEYYQALQTQIPKPIKSIPIPTFLLQVKGHLWVNLPEPAVRKAELTYFQSNQLKMYNQGIAVYETTLSEGAYTFNLTVHDFAIVYLDQLQITYLMREHSDSHRITLECKAATCKLRILVEAMGHINYGTNIAKDRKGLIGFKEEKKEDLRFLWDIYKIQINQQIFQWDQLSASMPSPLLLKGSFIINEIGDTFLEMSDFKKGYIWVNNKLLGRYWNIGPQQRLFCPGVWLKEGTNTVYVLQMVHNTYERIKGYTTLKD